MAINWDKPSKRTTPPPDAMGEVAFRRCLVCEWEGEQIERAGADPDCPWCHGPTERRVPISTEGVGPASKNPHAAALGRLGGLKGGKARAESLTPTQRRRIAARAARARWAKAPSTSETKEKNGKTEKTDQTEKTGKRTGKEQKN